MAHRRKTILAVGGVAATVIVCAWVAGPWKSDASRADRVAEVYARQMGYDPDEAQVVTEEALEAAEYICSIEVDDDGQFLRNITSDIEDLIEMADAGCPSTAEEFRMWLAENPDDFSDDEDPTQGAPIAEAARPPRSAYRVAASGTLQGVVWEVYRADTESHVCVALAGAVTPGATAPEWFVGAELRLEPSEARCVESAFLGPPNAWIEVTMRVQLPDFEDAVWGLAAPGVEQVEVATPDNVVNAAPMGGVFHLVVPRPATYHVRVTRDSVVHDCEPTTSLEDIWLLCAEQP